MKMNNHMQMSPAREEGLKNRKAYHRPTIEDHGSWAVLTGSCPPDDPNCTNGPIIALPKLR
jgi:hypothetical protein